jgi:hypothetical protein
MVPGPNGQPRPQVFLLTDPRITADDRRLIIEARLAAMARVGIPIASQRILRSDEAAALLGLPTNLSGVSRDELEAALRRAARRADELFGPRYARTAFESALRFRELNEERRRIAESAAFDLPQGRRITDALDREEALWRFSYHMTPPGFDVGSLDPDVRGMAFQGLRPDFGMGRRAITPPPPGFFSSSPQEPENPSGATTPQDIADLLANPNGRQRAFDRRFGAGAAAQILMGSGQVGSLATRHLQDLQARLQRGE